MKKAPVASTGKALKKLDNSGYEAAGVMLEVLVDEDELDEDELDEEDESLDEEEDELLEDEAETAEMIESMEVSRVSSAVGRVVTIGSSVVMDRVTNSPVVCIPK